MDDTKSTLLIEAQRLLQVRGFDSFSFQDLADKAGIRKASVYSHFKDKEELGVKLIEKYLEDFISWKDFHSKKGPTEQLLSFARMLKRVYLVGEQLCVNGACFSDWEVLPTRMQKQARALQNVQLEWIVQCLEHSREKGELKFEGSPMSRAQLLFVTWIGALQAARAWKDPDVFDVMSKLSLQDLGWKRDAL